MLMHDSDGWRIKVESYRAETRWGLIIGYEERKGFTKQACGDLNTTYNMKGQL